jgi:hypothetical protein
MAWYEKVVEISYLSRPLDAVMSEEVYDRLQVAHGIRIHLKEAFVCFFDLFQISRVFSKPHELVPSLSVVGTFAQTSSKCIPFRNRLSRNDSGGGLGFLLLENRHGLGLWLGLRLRLWLGLGLWHCGK